MVAPNHRGDGDQGEAVSEGNPGCSSSYLPAWRQLHGRPWWGAATIHQQGQEVPVEVLDAYLEVVTEGRKL